MEGKALMRGRVHPFKRESLNKRRSFDLVQTSSHWQKVETGWVFL